MQGGVLTGKAPPSGYDAGREWADCMRAGDFAAAWAIGDAVAAGRDPASRDDPALPYHLRWVWDGTGPDGRRVLVRCYHGLGDTLQFARFLPALRRRAAHVTLEVQPELHALLAGMDAVDRLVPFDGEAPLPPSECSMEIMDLAHVLRVHADEVGASVPYLATSPLLGRNGRRTGRIGLCWAAGGWDAARSVPLEPLLAALPGGHDLVSLQRGPCAAESARAEFANPGDHDTDVIRTAALIAGLDVVVSVDTMVAHLAGALGRRVILLVRKDADWRWPYPGRSCPWYPSMTVLHQTRTGEWGSVLTELARLMRTVSCR